MCLTPEQLDSLKINLLAGIIIFVFGLTLPFIPRSWKRIRMCLFWGRGIFKENVVISHSTLRDSRIGNFPIRDHGTGGVGNALRTFNTGSFQPVVEPEAAGEQGIAGTPPQYRYRKIFQDGHELNVIGPWEDLVAAAEVRGASYLFSALGAQRKYPIKIEKDSICVVDLTRKIISIGGPFTNESTHKLLQRRNNIYFKIENDAQGSYILDIKSGTKIREVPGEHPKDYGVIIKLKDKENAGNIQFVCAGLGEWGTSGACWYLANNWRKCKYWNEFGIIVEVDIGTDSNTRNVTSEKIPKAKKRKPKKNG